MKIHSSSLQTLLGSFHADIWEVDEVPLYIESLSEIDRMALKNEMETLLQKKGVDSKFMRKFISDDFRSDKHAADFFEAVFEAAFAKNNMPNIDDYIQ